MIPLLLISNNKPLLNLYVDKLKKNGIFFEVSPLTTKEYSIEDIKSVIKETKIFNPKTRFYYLPDFHLSSIPAQNSFLKLLEEPPENVQFILSTDNKSNLLPTIISRVKIVKLDNQDRVKPNQELAEILSELIEKHNLKNLNKNLFKQLKKEDVTTLLDQIINYFRDRLESDKNSTVIIKEIFYLKRLLESNNLNPQLTIDQALIFIWKQYSIKL
jgi:DNA polymerase-3 subunit delta'